MEPETSSLLSVKSREEFRKQPIDGQVFKELVEAGLTWLRTNQQMVNLLNVFPVPDGDTGTNMVLTMQSACDEVNHTTDRNIGRVIHAIARGALMGARGNSGVILSQLWRGFARALDEQETLDGASLVRAFAEARNTAYRGVVRPVEGTILTVAKDIAAAAEEALQQTDDPVLILEHVVAEAEKSVQRTPELLPVLKEAGVVDAGGMGLYFLLDGMVRYIHGQPLDLAVTTVQPLSAIDREETMELIEPGQDYEVVIDFRPYEPLNLEKFYNHLMQMGTSIQLGEGDGLYRLHIHVPTEKRYEPIDYTMSLAVITKVAMENLTAQMQDLERKSQRGGLTLSPIEPEQIAAVAVVPGMGIARLFASLGVAAIVEGGQTMNPSTQEIYNAFENLPTDKIIILPNNKNIIPAAQAAAEMSTKKVAVVPSRSIPQGLAAMLRLAPEGDFDQVVDEMTQAMEEVQSGEITIATRDVEINGVKVQEGQYIALLNGQLVLSDSSLDAVCLGLLQKANAHQYELITLFYGNNVSEEEANHIAELIQTAFPKQGVEVHEGGQPFYPFIISIE